MILNYNDSHVKHTEVNVENYGRIAWLVEPPVVGTNLGARSCVSSSLNGSVLPFLETKGEVFSPWSNGTWVLAIV
jgi:hypothetical protein